MLRVLLTLAMTIAVAANWPLERNGYSGRCRIMSHHHVHIHDAEVALRRAIRAYLWRRHLRHRRRLVSWAVLLVGAGFAIATDDFGFLSGAAVASVALLTTMMVLIWRARQGATLSRWRQLEAAGAEMIFDSEAFSIKSSIGGSTTPWSRFTEVWLLPKCWMLFTAPDQFQILLITDIPPEALAFVKERLAGVPTQNA